MPRSGGTYSLPSGNPVVSGATISSTTHNATMVDIAAALTASVAKDGQTVPTANLPMGGYRHTNVDDAGARTDYARADQVQDGTLVYLTSPSGTNTITATAPLSLAAYAAGQAFRFIAAATNTGAVTVNINSIGAKAVTKHGTTALTAGDIQSGQIVEIVYDGTRFQLCHLQPASTGSSLVLLETETASTSATLDFTLPTDYENFVLEIVNLKPATDGANIDVTLSSDGSTYFSASYAWTNDRLNSAATASPEGSASDSSIQLASNIGNQDGEQLSGTVRLAVASGMGTRLNWDVNGVTASSVFVQVKGAGAYAGAAAAYVRLVASSGNLTSGTARLYGVKK